MIDFIKRVLSRAVNKKSLESLAYSGTFDCFPEYHRAQYFYTGDGDRSNGMEKLIAYAQAIQSMTTGTTNTLFGDLPSAMQVPIPKFCHQRWITHGQQPEPLKDIQLRLCMCKMSAIEDGLSQFSSLRPCLYHR